MVRLRPTGFTMGQAALKASSSKVVNHEKMYFNNQHAFIPFAFDTFDFLALEAVDLLQRVQRLMHNKFVSSRKINVVFKRFGFSTKKGVVA